MAIRALTLREERSGKDSRYLGAHIAAGGDLVIEGQDLGPGVEAFWGDGQTEYEWSITVRAAHLEKLVAALGGLQGDDPLALLGKRFEENESCASKSFLEENDVPLEFWSRVGD